MIPLTKDPDDLVMFGIERCCLCRAPTRFWYVPKDVACCPACAEKSVPADLPSKKEWMRREDEIALAEERAKLGRSSIGRAVVSDTTG